MRGSVASFIWSCLWLAKMLKGMHASQTAENIDYPLKEEVWDLRVLLLGGLHCPGPPVWPCVSQTLPICLFCTSNIHCIFQAPVSPALVLSELPLGLESKVEPDTPSGNRAPKPDLEGTHWTIHKYWLERIRQYTHPLNLTLGKRLATHTQGLVKLENKITKSTYMMNNSTTTHTTNSTSGNWVLTFTKGHMHQSALSITQLELQTMFAKIYLLKSVC